MHDVDHDLAIYGFYFDKYLAPEGISVCFSSWARPSDTSLPLAAKVSGAYINSSIAKSEAVRRGFDEAVLLRSSGAVAEASGMNIMLVHAGHVITPSIDQDILPGITRDSVLKLAQAKGLTTTERVVNCTEVLEADEVFLVGTSARITPVRKVEEVELLAPGPVTAMLDTELMAIQCSHIDHPWVDRVPLR